MSAKSGIELSGCDWGDRTESPLVMPKQREAKLQVVHSRPVAGNCGNGSPMA